MKEKQCSVYITLIQTLQSKLATVLTTDWATASLRGFCKFSCTDLFINLFIKRKLMIGSWLSSYTRNLLWAQVLCWGTGHTWLSPEKMAKTWALTRSPGQALMIFTAAWIPAENLLLVKSKSSEIISSSFTAVFSQPNSCSLFLSCVNFFIFLLRIVLAKKQVSFCCCCCSLERGSLSGRENSLAKDSVLPQQEFSYTKIVFSPW